jgi:hypothetical protein
MMDSRAEPIRFSIGEDGTAHVEVHVTARGLNGHVLFDEKAGHVFQIEDGLASTILMLIPRTAVLGCILVTGYLGGATATQVRVQDPWFLFPVVLGVLSWLGLYLRDSRLRELLPFRT